MKILLKWAMPVLVTILLITGSAFGFGMNITIYDQRGVNYEDGETEPGMINNQSWDLEAFYLDWTTLSIVGGFDFVGGVPGYKDYQSGDIRLFEITVNPMPSGKLLCPAA
jgi:hypothetical protein